VFKLCNILILSVCFYSQVYAKCQQRQSYGLLNETVLIDDLATLSSAQMLGRKTGSSGSFKAKSFLQTRFKKIGLTHFPEYPEYTQKFPLPRLSPDSLGVNIVGWLKGTQFANQFIVVTAHYDHLGTKGRHVFYGADDNASGVAALLAVAAKASEHGLSHSVIFLATDAEEQGLYGAKAFTNNLPVSKSAIQLNINLDMLSEGGRSNRLYASFTRGDGQLAELVKNVADIAGLCFISGHRKSQGFSRFNHRINWHKSSDHAAFAKIDVPYLFIGGGVHKRYHTTKDTFENINQKFYISAAETAWLVLQAADSLKKL
jgi:Zn-dependent M28 family amino/carboxypeptidase